MAKAKGRTENASISGAIDAFLAQTGDAVYVADASLCCLAASKAFLSLLGETDESHVVGKTPQEAFPDHAALLSLLHGNNSFSADGGSAAEEPIGVTGADGRRHVYRVSRIATPEEADAAPVQIFVLHDVTRQHSAQENYKKEIDYLFLDHGNAYGAWLLDVTRWRLVKSSIPEKTAIGIPQYDSIEALIEGGRNAAIDDDPKSFLQLFSQAYLQEVYSTGKRRIDHEYRRVMENGSSGWVHLCAHLLIDAANDHLMAVVLLMDIDEEKVAQHQLTLAAELDSMTGVLNHDATLGHIERYLQTEGIGGMHALFMVDRDRLKQINDTLGHQVGDDIIIETARVLRNVFRDNDVIGRVGGDEFLVLMKNAGKLQNVRRKAAELLQSLQCICGNADNTIETTGSIGVSLYKGDGKTMDKLYAEADTALYRAKADGRNRFVVYNEGSSEGVLTTGTPDSPLDTVNLKTLLNSIDGGIMILHAEGANRLTPVFFSDSFLVMMGGLTQEEAFALYRDGLIARIHPDDRTRVDAEFVAALKSGEPLRTTYRLLGNNDAYCWLSVGASIIKNANCKTDIYAVHTNIEKLMHREEKLASDEMRYRLAFSLTSRLLWELDIATERLMFYMQSGKSSMSETVVTGLPESLIDNGFIHPESADTFRRFYAALLTGKSEDKALLNCLFSDKSEYCWASIFYQTVFDSENRPVKAIGSVEELPNIERSQIRLAREEHLLHSVQSELLFVMKVNLSQNMVCLFQADEIGCFAPLSRSSYASFAEDMIQTTSCQEDRLLVQINLSRDGLLNAHAQGRRWKLVEFRRIDNGEIRWTKITASLIEDSVSRDLFAFLYARDVEKRRNVEALLPITPERDNVTHLYTQSTTERLLQGLMRSAGASEKLYSLSIIRICDLPTMNARVGVENVELEMMYIGRYLDILLDGDCIVGRYGGDSFIVFSADAQSDEWMRERIEAVLRRLSDLLSKDVASKDIEFICGVATESARNAAYSRMLSQALRICDAYRSSGSGNTHSFEQYVDSFRVSDEELKKSVFVPVEPEELERPLFSEEREALLSSFSAMLAADRYDISVNNALGTLGKFYGAQRVYTLSLLSGNTAVAGMHEWVAPGKHSTLRQLSGMTLSRLPMFKRALVATRPIIINGKDRGEEARHVDDGPWRFIILPIISENKVQGFLCIENPKQHYTDVALPHTLIPLLLHERARFGLNSTGMRVAGRDELTGLPDHSAYNSAMQSFNPDAFHAVGAFYVSITNMREINRERGVAFGDDMLSFAAQTLTEAIRKAQVYRMSGTEFAVICTNLSREAFQGSCARVQSILQRRYPKLFCFGAAWSDKCVSARKLLSDAEGLAHNGVEKKHVSISRPRIEEGNVDEIVEGLTNGRFFVLLQPQVDMRTGMITGAEALSRYHDANGNVIQPSEYIHLLEEAGHIRDLDYFVLDQTFRFLQDWTASGFMPVPISVNFSRQTLRSASVLASSLAIRSRYDVAEYLVELEVTESLGNYEPEALRTVMEGMNQQGFRFVLDDLGSEYSSLKTMGDFSFYAIKLDKSLIESFLYNTMSRSVVEGIVGVCAKNGVKCIAEGVMSAEQVNGLLESGCIYAQGHYFGKPMPAVDFSTRFLKKR